MARSADPGRFALARFYFEAVAPAMRRLESMEPRIDPDGTGPAPPSVHAVEVATAKLVEAASIACLGGEVGVFPGDEVVAMLDAHRDSFEAIARRSYLVPFRMPRDPRAELLLHDRTAEAASLRTVPDAREPDLARAVFQSAWLAMRGLRRDGPGKRLAEALRDPSDDGWDTAMAAAVAAIEPFLMADGLESIEASAIDALWPFDATVAMVAYLEGLRSWTQDLAPEGLAVAGAVARAHAWRFDLSTTPTSARWEHAVRLTSQALDILGPRLLDLASIVVTPEYQSWIDDFSATAKRTAAAWSALCTKQRVPQDAY